MMEEASYAHRLNIHSVVFGKTKFNTHNQMRIINVIHTATSVRLKINFQNELQAKNKQIF